jgi:hypothetical protein
MDDFDDEIIITDGYIPSPWITIPSTPHRTMYPLLDYLTANIMHPQYRRPRKMLTILNIFEDYFDMHTIDNSYFKIEDLNPRVRHLFECRNKAYAAYPFAQTDFFNENMRMLYMIWLFYFKL